MTLRERNLSIDIGGMSCDGCVASVTRVLSRLPGVRVLQVAVGSARIAVEEPGTTEEGVRQALEDAGFTASAIDRR